MDRHPPGQRFPRLSLLDDLQNVVGTDPCLQGTGEPITGTTRTAATLALTHWPRASLLSNTPRGRGPSCTACAGSDSDGPARDAVGGAQHVQEVSAPPPANAEPLRPEQVMEDAWGQPHEARCFDDLARMGRHGHQLALELTRYVHGDQGGPALNAQLLGECPRPPIRDQATSDQLLRSRRRTLRSSVDS